MHRELWQQEAAKIGGESLVHVITEVKEGQEKIIERLDTIEESHQQTIREVSRFKDAFPSGDFESHQRYHAMLIEQLAERRRLRIAIQEKTISGLVWSGIVAIGYALWNAFLSIIRP
jgi:hypothetical protein